VKPQLERLIAAAIVAVGLALALAWVFRMPLFQSPDENAHADYAFALFTTRALIVARDARPATDLHPTVRYLEDASGFRTIRYNPDGRVPAGYGTAAYFRSLDRAAPHVAADVLDHNGGRVPWVARYYAYLYYALDALAIGVGALVGGGSVVAEFFAARIFNVVLLAFTLWLTWFTLVELRLGLSLRLALLATIAWFPLTSWVSAYVQSDNLAFTAVALVLYLSLRLRRESDVMRASLWLGLALGLLALTKPQYFFAAALPALADRTLRSAPLLRSPVRWATYVALAVGPAILGSLSALAVSSGAGQQVGAVVAANANPLGVMWSHGFPAFAGYVVGQIADAWRTTFYYGLSFVSYWGMISWTGYRFTFGTPALTDFVFTLLGLFSQIVALMVGVRAVLVWRRLAAVARRRSAYTTVRLFASDVLLNAYVLFGLVLCAVLISTGGQLGTQGRYWLPFILPALLCATHYAPQLIRRHKPRRTISTALGSGLLAYSVIGMVAGFVALEARFYRPPAVLSNVEYQARITRIGPYNLYEPHAGPLRLKSFRSYRVEGWAIDSRTGEPATGVQIVVDGESENWAKYGAPRHDAVDRLHDDGLLHSGFVATFKPWAGLHSLGLGVAERDGILHLSRQAVQVEGADH